MPLLCPLPLFQSKFKIQSVFPAWLVLDSLRVLSAPGPHWDLLSLPGLCRLAILSRPSIDDAGSWSVVWLALSSGVLSHLRRANSQGPGSGNELGESSHTPGWTLLQTGGQMEGGFQKGPQVDLSLRGPSVHPSGPLESRLGHCAEECPEIPHLQPPARMGALPPGQEAPCCLPEAAWGPGCQGC